MRLFPAYYVFILGFLILAALLGSAPRNTDNWGYAATYTYNLLMAYDLTEKRIMIVHLWSLCVEEQFYLIWPLVIFYCPPERLRSLLLALALAGPLLRYVTLLILPGIIKGDHLAESVYLLPTSHIDAFAIGGLLGITNFQARPWHFFLALLLTLGAGYWNYQRAEAPNTSAFWYPLYLEGGSQVV